VQTFYTLSASRGVQVDETFTNVRRAVRTVGHPYELARVHRSAWQSVHDVQALHAFLMFRETAATLRKWRADVSYSPLTPYAASTQGSESDGVPQLSATFAADFRQWMLSDACHAAVEATPYSSLARPPTAVECHDFDGGIMQTGVSSAIKRFLSLTASIMDATERSVVSPLALNGSGWQYVLPATMSGSTTTFNASQAAATNGTTVVPYSIPAVLQSVEMATAQELNLRYIQPLLLRVTDHYHEQALDAVVSYRLFVILFIAVGVTLISAAILAFFLPAIYAMDRDLQAKRALLLLLPPQTLVYVPTLRSFVEQIVAAAGGSGSVTAAATRATMASRRSARADAQGQSEDGGGGGGGGDHVDR